MSGYIAIQAGDTPEQVRAAINAQNSEQYGEMAQAYVTVADIAARDAIPAYYLVEGKIVKVVDSDGLGTEATYSWNGATWDLVKALKQVGTPIASATSITINGQVMHVTGTATINTILGGVAGLEIVLIPDDLWELGASGNIYKTSEAVVNKAMWLIYDGVKWAPSY